MKPIVTPQLLMVFVILSLCACSTTGGFLNKKTAREKYQQKIEKNTPQQSAAWIYAGDFALQHPLTIPVPYSETGFVSGEKADATAFYFSVKGGQKINIFLKKIKNTSLTAYTELWRVNENNEKELLVSADTLFNNIEYSSLNTGNYIVRMQPQLGARGSYTLNILINPLLGFPIDVSANGKIGSLWGDTRDAGARKHEGVDIFAKKGSAVVAVADGTIDYVEESDIGGKIISLIPFNQPFSVYYAHLDTQLVQDGQKVKKGDVIGTVGNTGNARFTVPHLHFGIYTRAGAIDPLMFIQKVMAPAENPGKNLNEWYKTSAKTKLYPSPSRQNAYSYNGPIKIKTESFSNNFYRVLLENGAKAFVALNELTDKMKL